MICLCRQYVTIKIYWQYAIELHTKNILSAHTNNMPLKRFEDLNPMSLELEQRRLNRNAWDGICFAVLSENAPVSLTV